MPRPIKIALVRPAVDVLHKYSKPVEALGIAYLASSLATDGHEARILDAMLFDWSPTETLEKIEEFDPDLIGFTVVLNHFPDRLIELLNLLAETSNPAPVVIGGHAVSFFPDRIL